MNSNLTRALAAALVAFGGVVPALAQRDGDSFCIDPNNTKPYSDDFRIQGQETVLFGANIGIGGTVSYASYCDNGGPIRGRIGFTIGNLGSIQDDANDPGGLHDNFLRLTRGASFGDEFDPALKYPGPYATPASGGNSYARIFVNRTTGAGATTSTDYLFGGTGFLTFFNGEAGRYVYIDTRVDGTASNNSVGVRLLIDVLGDTARLSWRLTNNLTQAAGETVNLGLYFGQVVELLEENQNQIGEHNIRFGSQGGNTAYITIPGRKPLIVDERFNGTGVGTTGIPGTATLGVPPYANFSLNQRYGYGLQVVNDPSALTAFDATANVSDSQKSGADQTPVDEFVIGRPHILIDGYYSTTDPTFPDLLFNGDDPGNNDTAPLTGSPAYLQKWLPTSVDNGAHRDIVAYYRSTTGDSSYSGQFTGYTAVVDTPKAISTDPAKLLNPTGGTPAGSNSTNPFRTNPFTVRVYVDNTGGFNNVGTASNFENVTVRLNLPIGMHRPTADGGGPLDRTLIKEIDNVDPGEINFVDFRVEVDADVVGAKEYTVDIDPTPGAVKTIRGTINVAATPRLLVRQGVNLVSPPWQFGNPTWRDVLNLDVDTQFQAFRWNAATQRYEVQTQAERGVGTWLISADDHGSIPLGGTPVQPDEFPLDANIERFEGQNPPRSIQIRQGWNLIGNPFNYAFPLGQLVGSPSSAAASLSFEELQNGYSNFSLSYYDQDAKSYQTITGSADARLDPNRGYWLFAEQDFLLQFPPLYELFIRSASPAEPKQRFDNWKFQMSASSASAKDSQNFAGIVSNPVVAVRKAIRKAPMPPISPKTNVLYSYFVGDNGAGMAQSLRRSRGAQTFSYGVFTQKSGPVVLSWPNLKSLPSNLAVTVTDTVSKRSVDARKESGYTFSASDASVRSFTVKVVPQNTPPARIGAAGYTIVKDGKTPYVKVTFQTYAKGSATLTVYKGKSLVGTIASDMDVNVGVNSAPLWSMVDSSAQPLPNGSYTVKIVALNENGESATYSMPITIRR